MTKSPGIYLDYNATCPLTKGARAAMVEGFELIGNGSSIHKAGRHIHSKIEAVREQLAGLLGARANNIIFTSSGTEANNLALSPSIFDKESGEASLLLSSVEHASVLKGHRFADDKVQLIKVSETGLVDLDHLSQLIEALIDENEKFLASVMLVNNETGVIQPIRQIADRFHEAGGLLHVDCVQALGKLDCSFEALGADMITLSAHKIGGPQGVGALALRNCFPASPKPMIKGGGQETSWRAGTENLLGILGFGGALADLDELQSDEVKNKMVHLQTHLETELKALIPSVVIIGEKAPRVKNTVCFAVPGMRAEQALIKLDLKDIYISSGAACSSGRLSSSHVLKAMGFDDDLASCGLRVSMGAATTKEEIDRFLDVFQTICKKQKPQMAVA